MAGKISSGVRSKKKTPKKQELLFCTFCGKNHQEVTRLVAGPGVYICDKCVSLCNEILSSEANQDTSDSWQGWDSMTDEELLATLPATLRSAENVRGGLQSRIDELRKRKVSWTQIGKTLSMSRQAAWERFA